MLMELGNILYVYEKTDSESQKVTLQTTIMEHIKSNDMAPFYEQLSERFGWSMDESLKSTMKSKNIEEFEKIEAKIQDAATNAGDTEVIDGMFLKARYQARIGMWEAALSTFDEIISKPKAVTGKKIDANMEKAKVLLFILDLPKLKIAVEEAKRLNEIGGDWDRRNRLKVYEAYYMLAVHDVKQAAKLLLDCVATFTCTELCSYTEFMFYALLSSLVTLNRTELQKRIIQDPQVITVIRDLPRAQALVWSVYQCQYRKFFEAVVEILPDILADRFLGPLATYLVREFRVLAYLQFLEAYKSVKLSSMAASFGVTISLLDSELSRFIAAGRLNAKIDKVGDIVETRRPDKKNAQYHEIIKKGDQLLNQVQRLVRVIDV